MRVRTLLLASSSVLLALSGCFGGSAPKAAEGLREFLPLDKVVFDGTGNFSWPVTPWPDYIVGNGTQAGLRLLIPGFGSTPIEVGIIRPKIEDCPDGLDGDFPERCRTPVLMDAGPYFTPDSIDRLSTRPPTGIWFVPHGYTMVYVAVRGTSGSDGCMEFMSRSEQKDVDAAVTWAANQKWSTGSVGMIGRSYDGTTPLWPAAMGNPHLKTIVPISGVVDQADLMFANGTSELRGPIMHSYVYWLTYGFEAEPDETKASQVCPEVVRGAAVGPYTTVTGDIDNGGLDKYWQERRWGDEVAKNYKGSVFVIHGMQDWNVNPRMVVPWIQQLQDNGIPTKVWLGQWGHAYPDRADEHPNVRWDWAEVLLRWFDHELKGLDVDTGPAVEVEDHRHQWWVGESYPPRNVTFVDLPLADMTVRASVAGGNLGGAPIGAGGVYPVAGSGPDGVVQSVAFTSQALPTTVRMSGLVQLPLKVAPTTPQGGNVYVTLRDVYPDGRSVWLGHGWMNLLYYAGGHERQTLVPGQPVTAKIQFEPIEAFLPAGHMLRVEILQDFPSLLIYPEVDSIPNPARGPFLVYEEGSMLRIPVHEDFRPSPYDTYTINKVVEKA